MSNGLWEYRYIGDPDRYPQDGDRDGLTYDPDLDYVRLNREMRVVFEVIRRGGWFTLPELADLTGCMMPSISARLRDFRKPQFGGRGGRDPWPVERRRRATPGGAPNGVAEPPDPPEPDPAELTRVLGQAVLLLRERGLYEELRRRVSARRTAGRSRAY